MWLLLPSSVLVWSRPGRVVSLLLPHWHLVVGTSVLLDLRQRPRYPPLEDSFNWPGTGPPRHPVSFPQRKLVVFNWINQRTLHLILERFWERWKAHAGSRNSCPQQTSVEQPLFVSPRPMSTRMRTGAGYITVISAYAPTLLASDEDEEEFYQQLSDLLSSIPADHDIALLGDFNARIEADADSWTSVIGLFGVGKINKNRECLLQLCSLFNLSVASSFFKSSLRSKVTWMHPRSRRWHQLDYVIIRRRQLRALKQAAACTPPTAELIICSGSLQASNHTKKVLSNPTEALAPCRRLLYTRLSPQSALSTAAIF